MKENETKKTGIFGKLKEKNKDIKSNIDPEVGNKVFTAFRIMMILLFWLVIPLTATLLTTLAGAGTISLVVYQAIIWPLWILLVISYILWSYFKEFRNEHEE